MQMEKLKLIIKKIFKIEAADINDELSPATISTWDSMNYLIFISEIEKEFQITFTMDEILKAKNLGDIKAVMNDKGIRF